MASKRSLTPREKSEMTHFDLMAQNYDLNYTYDTPFTQYKIHKKLQLLFKNLPKKKKISILEVGAGTGEYTQYLAQLFPNAKITAVDISPQILKVAAEKCQHFSNISFKVASAYDLPFEDKSFDLVCGFYILHHLDVHSCLTELHRVLKTKATARFYEPNALNPVVSAIKNIPFLKERAGDSPEESAINPWWLKKNCQPFLELRWLTSEFVVIPAAIPISTAIRLDIWLSKIGSLPVLRLFGGSVSLIFKKS